MPIFKPQHYTLAQDMKSEVNVKQSKEVLLGYLYNQYTALITSSNSIKLAKRLAIVIGYEIGVNPTKVSDYQLERGRAISRYKNSGGGRSNHPLASMRHLLPLSRGGMTEMTGTDDPVLTAYE